MIEPRLHHVQCLDARGLHRVAYWEWGERTNPKVLVCVHGLTRQGRDFDTLARALCTDYRVVCPDVVGRGHSDWLADPMGYQVAAYVADMVTLLARLDAKTLNWVGTSLGGLIGMGVASLAKSPVHRLVLNDVGPVIQAQAIQRIGAYVGLPLRWDSVEDAAAYMLSISKGFGPHTDAQWLDLTRPMLRADGARFKPHYDPAIALPFRAVTPESAAAGEAQLWRAFDAIACPTLVLRGADSDLLSRETAQQMAQRGPRATLCEFEGVGHAPTLVAQDQVDVVKKFLLSP